MKSLTMLLAAGCKLPNDFDTVVPIIIDPDIGNGDLNRSKRILSLYQEIRNQIDQPNNFFSQEIKTIYELANESSNVNPQYYHFNLDGIENSTFGEYIGYNRLSDDGAKGKDDKAFTKLLYSEANLKSNLDVGFKGNPNMGSIVLNQFSSSEDFKRFAQTFHDDDGIFIVSSIFGGTGAAGFPLLLKNLRGNDSLPNHLKIKDCNIGAITYLPYFALDRKEEIDSDSFDDKAKVAIDYYNRTIIDKNEVDILYFVGNRGNTKHLKYSVGGKEQTNDAHFLELAGALAIFDFCKHFKDAKSRTLVKEFGIQRDTDSIEFSDLNNEDARLIAFPLTKFKLYAEYLKKGLNGAINKSRWTKSNIKLIRNSKNSCLDQNYFNSAEYLNQVGSFNNLFLEWVNEMESNKPAFRPFNTVEPHNALSLVKGVSPSVDKGFKAVDTENCLLIDTYIRRHSNVKIHTPLITLFDHSTKNVLDNAGISKQISNE